MKHADLMMKNMVVHKKKMKQYEVNRDYLKCFNDKTTYTKVLEEKDRNEQGMKFCGKKVISQDMSELLEDVRIKEETKIGLKPRNG